MNSKIKKFLLDAVNNHVFPGCCAAIIHNQTTEYYCVGNKATHPYQEANKIDTLYDLASLTKVVSTTPAVLRLIQKGFVHYETTVKSIIPQFQNNDITIFHLLTHTSGLPADLNWGIKANKEEMINDICQISHSVVPGKKVIYSDLGYILLGYLIEVLTSDNLRKVVDDEIFLPLNMQHTMYCPPESLKGKCAPTELSLHFNRMLRGEVHDRKAHLLNGIAGHAGIFSNVNDL